MEFIQKIVRSKPFDALMAALFGALVGAVIMLIGVVQVVI